MRLRKVVLVSRKLHPLSPNQVQCLDLYGRGFTYNEISEVTGMSWHTVKNHLHQARKRLGTHTTAQAFIEFIRRTK